MRNIPKGRMAGLVATIVLSVLLEARLPSRSHVGHGVMLGLVGWLIMMIMMMPMAGAGLFGMKLGIMAPMMTLVLHLIVGATLGWIYGRSIPSPMPRSLLQ